MECGKLPRDRLSQGRVFGLIGLIDGQKKCSGLGCIKKKDIKL